jgi:hypothetical protein
VDGVASEYTGGRTAAEIVSWVKRKAVDPVTELRSIAEADAFVGAAADGYVVIGRFKDLQACCARSSAAVLRGC